MQQNRVRTGRAGLKGNEMYNYIGCSVAVPDPVVQFDADPDPTFQFDPDPGPTTRFPPVLDPPMLKNYPLRLPPFHFDADPDPASQNDAEPCGSGSGSATLL